jgi:hypothetical protein
MRTLPALCLIVVFGGFICSAQVLPTANGSCGVSASGVMDCDWVSAANLRRQGVPTKATATPVDKGSQLFTTRYVLAPGAPLEAPNPGQNALIVAMNSGEFVNEKSSTQSHVDVWSGLVMMMPIEPYLLRNVGKENLELLVIEVRKRPLLHSAQSNTPHPR